MPARVELPQAVHVRPLAGSELADRQRQATGAVGSTRGGRPVVVHHGADDIVLELVVAADDRIDRADDHQPAGSAKQERVDGHHPASMRSIWSRLVPGPPSVPLVFFAAPRCVDGILEGEERRRRRGHQILVTGGGIDGALVAGQLQARGPMRCGPQHPGRVGGIDRPEHPRRHALGDRVGEQAQRPQARRVGLGGGIEPGDRPGEHDGVVRPVGEGARPVGPPQPRQPRQGLVAVDGEQCRVQPLEPLAPRPSATPALPPNIE